MRDTWQDRLNWELFQKYGPKAPKAKRPGRGRQPGFKVPYKRVCECGATFRGGSPAHKAHMKHFPHLCRPKRHNHISAAID